MTTLPAHWRLQTLAEVMTGGLLADGDWVETKDQDPHGSVRLTQLADVGVGEFRNRSDRWMRPDQATRLGCTFLQTNDVLVARMPDPIGRACLVPDGLGSAVTAVDVAVLRPARDDVDPRYLMWAINSPEVHLRIASLQSGTTRKRVSRKNLATITMPVPPLNEQRRIVDILEDHLSRLDAADRAIASTLVKTRALAASRLQQLPPEEAPEALLGELAIDSGYGTSTKCVVDGPGVPVVRIPNLVDGRIDLTDEKRAADGSVILSALMLAEGDLLIVRTNGSRDLIGRSAVVQSGVRASFASYLIRYQFDADRVEPHWVRVMLERPAAREHLERMAASTAGQYNLSLGKLNSVSIPLPVRDEQRRLLATFDVFADGLDQITAELKRTTARSSSLRRALLAAAFSGRLTGRSSDLEIAEELMPA